MPTLSRSLFGDYSPTPETRPARPKGTPERTRALFSGLDCLPDQGDLFDVDGHEQAAQTTTEDRRTAYRQGFRRLIDALDRTRLFAPAEIREIVRRCDTPTASTAARVIIDLYGSTLSAEDCDTIHDTLTEGL